VQKNLSQIPKRSAAGVDGQTVEAATESYVWRAVDHEGEILDTGSVALETRDFR